MMVTHHKMSGKSDNLHHVMSFSQSLGSTGASIPLFGERVSRDSMYLHMARRSKGSPLVAAFLTRGTSEIGCPSNVRREVGDRKS